MKLLKGDCLKVMKDIPDESIDLVLTDPPYGTTACKWDSVIDLELMWKELKRVTKHSSAIVLMTAQPFTSVLICSNLPMYKYEWVWVKNLKTGNLNARRMPMGGHETVQVFYNKPPIYNPQKRERTTEIRSGNKYNSKTENYGKQSELYLDRQSDWINPDTVLKDIKCVHNSSGKLHPTQKPVELMEYLIKTYSNSGQTILDFAMGSGTTGLACKNTGRQFIGIEKDEKYFNIAQERLK